MLQALWLQLQTKQTKLLFSSSSPFNGRTQDRDWELSRKLQLSLPGHTQNSISQCPFKFYTAMTKSFPVKRAEVTCPNLRPGRWTPCIHMSPCCIIFCFLIRGTMEPLEAGTWAPAWCMEKSWTQVCSVSKKENVRYVETLYVWVYLLLHQFAFRKVQEECTDY